MENQNEVGTVEKKNLEINIKLTKTFRPYH